MHILKSILNIDHNKNRFYEIDVFRGIAIVLMVYYHFTWDLTYYQLFTADFMSGFWQIFGRSIACLFMIALGCGLSVLYGRMGGTITKVYPKVIKRGLVIFAWGLFITLVTFIQFGNRGFVIFGILHFLGFAVIAGYPLTMLNRWLLLFLVIPVAAIGYFMHYNIHSEHPWLLWLGVRQYGRLMFDYYPLFPWFAAVFYGLFLGKTLYPNGQRASYRNRSKHILFFWIFPVIVGAVFILIDTILQNTLYTDPLLPYHIITDFYNGSTLAVPFIALLIVTYITLIILSVVTPGKENNRQLPDLSGVFPFNFLSICGRYSLPIYLVHQPLFMAILGIIVPLLKR